MARLGVTKKKKGPRANEVRRLKKELQRVTERLESRERELAESLAQQTATSETLRVISRSPTAIQPVLDAVTESAARLCDAFDAVIFRRDDDRLRLVAHHGQFPTGSIGEFTLPLVRGSPNGRSVLDGRTIQVADLQSEVDEFPEGSEFARRFGFRTVLLVPLMREGVAIGSIGLRRTETRLFTEQQVTLLETFADQAVIAIENVRLFKELQDRNRQLTEALEQQIATSEILGVIASSPTDTQPVLDVVAESAARLCEANDAQILRVDGDILRLAASYGSLPTSETRPINRQLASGRAVIDRQTIHVHDIAVAEDEFPYTRTLGIPRGIRTFLATPLLCNGDPIGAIVIRRTEVRPFSDKQIALLKTFADQAVIAIENVRLFQELKEALEQQTATSEILGVIASSPTDIQPVLDVIAENATRVCGADDINIRLVEGKCTSARGPPGLISIVQESELPIDRGSVTGRAVIDS